MVEDWNMQTKFTRFDLLFLTACGITATEEMECEPVSRDRAPINYTLDWMKKNKIPLTKENYRHIECIGQQTDELDAEAELPPELQDGNSDEPPVAEQIESMTGGDCGEASHTTLSGIPRCQICERSTRNRNAVVCSPCRKLLSAATKAANKWYHQKIKMQGLGQEMNEALHRLNPAQQTEFCKRYKRQTGRDYLD